jgi:hypothetical protein
MAKRKTPPFHVAIPECPAADRCQKRKIECSICLELTEDEWRDHVGKVLSRRARTTTLNKRM